MIGLTGEMATVLARPLTMHCFSLQSKRGGGTMLAPLALAQRARGREIIGRKERVSE